MVDDLVDPPRRAGLQARIDEALQLYVGRTANVSRSIKGRGVLVSKINAQLGTHAGFGGMERRYAI